jgi:MFS family permease
MRPSNQVEREPRYAWVVVAVLSLALAVASGTQGTFGLLVKPWEVDFGWERAAISLTASIGFVFYGISQALSGRWADRIGPRAIFTAGLVILGVGTAAISSIVTLWQAYLVFGVLMSIGVGAASSSTAAVAIARWFTRRRGLAVGIVTGGSAAGYFVLLPLMAAFLQTAGWRSAFLWLGASIVLVMVPIVLWLLRNDPGGHADRDGAGTAMGRPLPLIQLGHHANFWALAGSFFICGVTSIGVTDAHLIPHAQDHHIATVTAASAFGVLALVNTIFTTLSGAVADRVGYKRLLCWIYAGRAITLVFLIFARDPVSLFIFAVAFGIVDFATVAPTVALSTTLFGSRSAGTVFGLVSLSHQVSAALGSYAGGLIHDLTGSYSSFFASAAILAGAAAAIAWAISETQVVGGLESPAT